MDDIEVVQNVDNGGGHVVGDCLKNAVVVRKIFQYFSSTELLELSLVNKLWNYEARSEMRQRKNIVARVRCTDHQHCQKNVEAFLSFIRRMNQNRDLQQTNNIVPFTGISIEINPWGHTCEYVDQDLFHDVLFGQLALKKVDVDVFGEMCEFENCPGLLLVKKVFRDCSRSLDELSLKIEHERHEFMEQVVQDCRFPRLKVLKLQETYGTVDEAYTNYMKELVSRAPRLQKFQTQRGSINSMLNALEGSSAVIRYQPTLHAPFDEISETATNSLRLGKISFCFVPDLRFERFNRITPVLLQASCTATLRYMSVSAVLAIPLMCYGIRLEKLEALDMHFNYGQLELAEPWVLEVVKGFDFTRIFPKLNRVKICRDNPFVVSTDHRNRMIAQANAILREPMPDRAANVKELCFNNWNLSDVTAQYFAEMFPNTEKLELVAPHEEQIQFGSIGKHWKDLKELEVQGNVIRTSGNLDSVFCGIFPEEVAELRLKDEEFLKRVNIVPVMPAITCLRNLRALTLNHEGYDLDAFDHGPTFMFSQVTALIAFARCPALSVSLNVSSFVPPPAMTHLKPYVSVKSVVLEVEDNIWDFGPPFL